MNRRILFVNYTAGTSGPTHSLEMMLAYLRRHYDVAVVLPETGPLTDWLRRENIPTFFTSGMGKKSIWEFYQLQRREGVDLVYGNNPSTYSRNAMLAAHANQLPFIWHFRGVKWHWGWKKGIFLRWAQRVVAVSNAAAKSIARFYPIEKIHVIYNGVELPVFNFNREEGRRYIIQQVGLPPDARILLCVSQVKPRKGQDEAVAIMSRLIEQRKDIHLVIAGALDRDPPYTQNLRRLISQANLDAHFHLLGLRDDIPQLMAGADIFLHLARQDAHPRAVIEAMAASLPIVAFGVDGVAETVLDGVTGCLVRSGDWEAVPPLLLSLLDDPARMAAFGRQAQRHVQEHFTAESTAGKIEALIRELLPA